MTDIGAAVRNRKGVQVCLRAAITRKEERIEAATGKALFFDEGVKRQGGQVIGQRFKVGIVTLLEYLQVAHTVAAAFTLDIFCCRERPVTQFAALAAGRALGADHMPGTLA